MNQKDLTILVLSCDKYRDLWKPFFYCFRKAWKNCPYPIILGSNTKSYKTVKTILSGPDKDWSTSFLSILSQVKTPYIFLWLDDIFPIHTIQTKNFQDALEFFQANRGKHMHMSPVPKPDKILEAGKYGEFAPGAPYRCTAFGFWDVEYLKSILLPGENPWNFEILGSYRTSYAQGFYCSMVPLFKRLHVIEKGRIFQDAFEYCKKHRIPLDSSIREVLSDKKYLVSELQKIYFNTVIKIP